MGGALGFIGLNNLGMGYTVWKLRADAIEDSFRDTGNVVTLLAEQIAQTARSIDLVLSDMQDRIALLDVRTPDDLQRVISTQSRTPILNSILERFPQPDLPTPVGRAGQEVPSGALWHAAVGGGGGQFRSHGKVRPAGLFQSWGGVAPEVRLVRLRLVPGYPLATAVGVAESAALAAWRQRSAFIA